MVKKLTMGTQHPTLSANQDVLIIELNEFNVDLLSAAITQHSLPALAKVLDFNRSTYKTPDRYNSGYLEPWVQWVSIHASVPSTTHHIKHLGDVPDLACEQAWEVLSKQGVTTGVWGVMNGARRQAKQAHFFLPDPWTFTEPGHPNSLSALLDLPRYVAKNYQHLRKTVLFKKFLRLMSFICTSGAGLAIIKETINLLKHLRQFGKKHFVYICYFEYISALLFIRYKRKFQPKCSFLFLNSLAHLQHHHWTQGPTTVTPEILHGLQYLDRLLTLLFKNFSDDAIVVHNGLSQMNTNHEKPWVLYRQKDPLSFLQALAIQPLTVEQHMTHDGHVFFANKEECQKAFNLLKSAMLQGKRLFQVELNAQNPCKLFYQLNFTDDVQVADSVTFEVGDKTYSFFQHFDRIVTRTGRHIPIGIIFSNKIVFPDHIFNHEFNHFLFHALLPEAFPLPQEEEHDFLPESEISEPA